MAPTMHQGSAEPATNVTRDDVVGRARDMVPVLRQRAPKTEEGRRVPPETVQDFRDAGFYRILQPARYGGLELEYGTQTEIAAELGRGCGSSAWDASITTCHAWILGMYPGEAQDEVWGDDPEATVSTSFFSVGPQIDMVPGGVRLSGRWKFSSGVDHCDWAVLSFRMQGPDGKGVMEEFLALVRLADCTVEDTWYVTGLSGTGSNDIVVENCFVPDHRLLRGMELRGGPSPGSAVNPGYIYRLPLHGVFSFNLVGSAIGVARGALEMVLDGLGGKKSVTQATVGDQQSVQLRIAEACAEVDAAYALMDRNRAEINRQGRAGETPDMAQRVRYRRDNSYAAVMCVRAVDRVYPLLGGRGLAVGDPVQRAWRDVHAISHHIALTWDVQGVLHGSVALGHPCPDPRI